MASPNFATTLLGLYELPLILLQPRQVYTNIPNVYMNLHQLWDNIPQVYYSIP